MNSTDEYQALRTRFAAAHTLAQAVIPAIELREPQRNKKDDDPDPTLFYLLLYAAVPVAERMTMGSPAEEQRGGQVRIEIWVPYGYNDDDISLTILDAIRPAFVSGHHALLRFDEAMRVVVHGFKSNHFQTHATIPYAYDDSVTVAA